ncbi:hypothetical protein GCM10027567_07840 [Spongiibacter taiwanensis]
MTNSGPDTKNIGAAISGRERLAAIDSGMGINNSENYCVRGLQNAGISAGPASLDQITFDISNFRQAVAD